MKSGGYQERIDLGDDGLQAISTVSVFAEGDVKQTEAQGGSSNHGL